MLAYRYPAYRPAPNRPPAMKGGALGALQSMTLGDWLLLAGGAVVGGAGVNALVKQAAARRIDAISIALALILTGVGGTLFVQKFGKMVA